MFDSFSEFLHMGGYAKYVWPAYAIALFVLFANYILPLREKKQLLKQLSGRQEKTSCIHSVESV